MAPKFSSGVSIDGVIAYPDDADPNQWHYLPGRADLIVGDTLLDFEVTYWGINAKPYYIDFGEGNIRSSVGGILAGRARIDISSTQRANISAEITKSTGISSPLLLPLSFTNVKVKPVIAKLLVEAENSNIIFPDIIQLGTTFSYNVAAKNSLFAKVVAASNVSSNVVSRPSFSINVEGDIEFVGDPWVAELSGDLSQVWNYTRTQISASISYGWFTIGSADYDKIVQDLFKNNIIKTTFSEGSLDNEQFGRQILEAAKEIFEEINKQITNGEGLFRFEPNPSPQGSGGAGNGASWWPWNVSINSSYASNTFTQVINFKKRIEYKGRFKRPMSTAMVLAVGCNSSTQQFFNDIQNTSQPCLSQDKNDGLQARLDAEKKAKEEKATQYLEKLENGEWDFNKYERMMGILENITLTETAASVIPKAVSIAGITVESPAGFYTLSLEETLKQLEKLENEDNTYGL